MKILLVEDDLLLSDSVVHALETDYSLEQVYTVKEALIKLQMSVYDLILLDLILPDGTGMDICTKIRQHYDQLPILILTGKESVEQKVSALNSGADDYLTKPFEIEELRARINALLRRSTANPTPHTLVLDDLRLDLNQGIVRRGKVMIRLRRKEMLVLEYLMRHAGKVCTREKLFQYAWQGDSNSATNTVTVHIKYLRDRIDTPFTKKLIKTVHGWGYKIET